MGTPGYMSPEQVLKEDLDHRSDIWSVGVCLYELLTGCRPFRGDDAQAVLSAILHAQPEPVHAQRSDVPPELDRVLRRALSKRPDARYQEAHEMLRDLPEAIPGQRDGDRSHLGSNLIHDEATLKTMVALAEGSGRRDYAEAAERYLRRFATHCTGTETGILPWGELQNYLRHMVSIHVHDSKMCDLEGRGINRFIR